VKASEIAALIEKYQLNADPVQVASMCYLAVASPNRAEEINDPDQIFAALQQAQLRHAAHEEQLQAAVDQCATAAQKLSEMETITWPALSELLDAYQRAMNVTMRGLRFYACGGWGK
jgi:tRNA/tmRNA/rRNA uracil-C5-methylase (TrmA/RlmC/RlmD family)